MRTAVKRVDLALMLKHILDECETYITKGCIRDIILWNRGNFSISSFSLPFSSFPSFPLQLSSLCSYCFSRLCVGYPRMGCLRGEKAIRGAFSLRPREFSSNSKTPYCDELHKTNISTKCRSGMKGKYVYGLVGTTEGI